MTVSVRLLRMQPRNSHLKVLTTVNLLCLTVNVSSAICFVEAYKWLAFSDLGPMDIDLDWSMVQQTLIPSSIRINQWFNFWSDWESNTRGLHLIEQYSFLSLLLLFSLFCFPFFFLSFFLSVLLFVLISSHLFVFFLSLSFFLCLIFFFFLVCFFFSLSYCPTFFLFLSISFFPLFLSVLLSLSLSLF